MLHPLRSQSSSRFCPSRLSEFSVLVVPSVVAASVVVVTDVVAFTFVVPVVVVVDIVAVACCWQ